MRTRPTRARERFDPGSDDAQAAHPGRFSETEDRAECGGDGGNDAPGGIGSGRSRATIDDDDPGHTAARRPAGVVPVAPCGDVRGRPGCGRRRGWRVARQKFRGRATPPVAWASAEAGERRPHRGPRRQGGVDYRCGGRPRRTCERTSGRCQRCAGAVIPAAAAERRVTAFGRGRSEDVVWVSPATRPRTPGCGRLRRASHAADFAYPGAGVRRVCHQGSFTNRFSRACPDDSSKSDSRPAASARPVGAERLPPRRHRPPTPARGTWPRAPQTGHGPVSGCRRSVWDVRSAVFARPRWRAVR